MDLGGGGEIATILPANAVRLDVPGFGRIEGRLVGSKVVSNLGADMPDWISLSDTRLSVKTKHGRLALARSKTEIFRYSPGWELFFFTLDGPYSGHGPISLLLGPRLDPARANLTGMWQDFWSDKMWRHADVLWAIGETVLMAFLGTFGAAMIALPLAFLAARNFAPLVAPRFGVRRGRADLDDCAFTRLRAGAFDRRAAHSCDVYRDLAWPPRCGC